MLCRNIDVTMGLVNGAMGTAVGMYSTYVLIKFDHIDKPCQIKNNYKIHAHEKYVHTQKAIPSNISICNHHTQVSRIILRH